MVAGAVTAPIVGYAWVAAHRLGYPYELDWMEGGSVALAARAAAGHSLYVAPSLAYVGWTYPPLYYWVAAAISKVAGVGFFALRLLSLTASVAAMATLGAIVWRETRDRVAGLVAAGLFAATFVISGAWFDTGRVDSLFLALTLLTLAWGRCARSVRGGMGLGALAFLAFFTKQTALVAVLPTLLYLGASRARVGIPALLTLLGLAVVSTAGLDAASHGWYRYYVFSELSGQSWAQQVWASFWENDIWRRQWPLVGLVTAGGAMLWWEARGRVSWRSPAAYHVVAAAGLILSAWLSRLHTGGFLNVLMPAYAAVALLGGLVFGAVARRAHDRRARGLALVGGGARRPGAAGAGGATRLPPGHRDAHGGPACDGCDAHRPFAFASRAGHHSAPSLVRDARRKGQLGRPGRSDPRRPALQRRPRRTGPARLPRRRARR